MTIDRAAGTRSRCSPPRAGLVWGVVLVLAGSLPLSAAEQGAGAVSTRPPAVAGQFYPADGAKLKAAVTMLLANALPPTIDDPVAILVPHAGYSFSGQIAADGYRQVMRGRYDTIVIVGTNHTIAGFPRVSVYDGAAWRTPLGTVAVDRELAEALVKQNVDAVFDTRLHAQEHSVEVQVPFLQQLFPGAKILPLVVGAPDPSLCARVGRTLAQLVKDRRVLIVASSDLSHYPARADAIRVDRDTLEAIAGMSPAALQVAERAAADGRVQGLVTAACGEGSILLAMEAARQLGATRGVVVSYANSADSPAGDPGRVVGYGAVVWSKGSKGTDVSALARPASDTTGSLGVDDKRALLRIARDTIRGYLETDIAPLPRAGGPKVRRDAGVFVTLRKKGELRGCIGHLAADRALLPLVSSMALASALNDTRFEPVRAVELADIDVEVSVLTPMKPVGGASEIVVGRDGVVLRVGDRSAVFLPQVATEQGWGREEMLDNLSLKAGPCS
jgi:AmmeMemoRadiSam system protein B/AmmeMemoRadiSam system protein A